MDDAPPESLTLATGETAKPRRYTFSQDLVTLHDGRDSEAEAVRTIRTHLVARHLNDGRRGLAVCGPKAGVGCTFTAANLAVAMSQIGVSTLLIDTDLRRPGLEAFIRPETPPVSARDQADANDPLINVHPEVIPNLSLLYASSLSGSAGELLAGQGFRRLMDRCMRDFDFTIVDTAPTSEGADALRVASIVGYALVVARTNVSLLKDVDTLAKELQEDGARIVGSVLNEI
ncbi:MAG: CpsD/CapB family tyrosine-protein kinase [Phenylobacterium sp.]|nr:CpsD/CapB family tyrosine-protein kinase [Phenylobacterium sp.]